VDSYIIKKTRGDFGEAAVCDYLEKRGYKIIACNYLKRAGEIDIIAALDNIIAFIEVKTRKFNSLTDGLDSITREKRRKIVKTAQAFLAENPQYYDADTRFDAAEVTITTDEIPQVIEIEYYEEAFNPALL
jgi:putative endonuclease